MASLSVARMLSAFGSKGTELGSLGPLSPVSASELDFTTPTDHADPYLNSLLVRYCEEALSNRRVRSGAWRLKVENAIVPLLPHGQATKGEIAQRLGVSGRTLSRLLASEGCSFGEILDALRLDLAKSYLREQNLPISEVAWLLGYKESSAFDHACKRWTGKAPTQIRSVEILAKVA